MLFSKRAPYETSSYQALGPFLLSLHVALRAGSGFISKGSGLFGRGRKVLEFDAQARALHRGAGFNLRLNGHSLPHRVRSTPGR